MIRRLSTWAMVGLLGLEGLTPLSAGAETPVTIRGHATARGVDVSHANALLVETQHASSLGTIAHITSVTHVAGAMQIRNQAGTLVTVTGTALDVNCTGCAAASVVAVSHVASVTHIAAAGPLPVVQSVQQGAWPVTAHQGGVWNVNHVSSALHVVTGQAAPLHVVASTGSGNMVCHSTASFATSASGIVIHVVSATNRIFICGVIIGASAAANVSLVEGTAALCGTGTTPMIASSVAAGGLNFAAGGGLVAVAPFPWLVTATAGNQVCLLTDAGRVSGTITYRAGP